MGFEDLRDVVNRACTASLGIPATWTPRGSGPPVPLRAIFRRQHRIFDPETGAMVAATETSAWVRLADLTREPLEDDLFTADGLDFVVASFEPDGEGGGTMVLQRAPAP